MNLFPRRGTRRESIITHESFPDRTPSTSSSSSSWIPDQPSSILAVACVLPSFPCRLSILHSFHPEVHPNRVVYYMRVRMRDLPPSHAPATCLPIPTQSPSRPFSDISRQRSRSSPPNHILGSSVVGPATLSSGHPAAPLFLSPSPSPPLPPAHRIGTACSVNELCLAMVFQTFASSGGEPPQISSPVPAFLPAFARWGSDAHISSLHAVVPVCCCLIVYPGYSSSVTKPGDYGGRREFSTSKVV